MTIKFTFKDNLSFMKLLTFLIVVFFSIKDGYAQHPDLDNKTIGSVSYHFLHQRDTLSEKYYEESMGLVFSKHSALYFSLNKETRDSAMKKMMEEQMKNASDGAHLKINLTGLPSVTPGAYYSFYQRSTVGVLRPYMKIDYVYDQTLSNINWTISNEAKEIAGFNCNKALGFFGGRLYEAWFCSDIPVSAGPWKLHGLPGLIMEAADTSGQVRFLFQSFSTTDFYNKTTIALPTNAEKTTKEDFEKMLKAMRDNPQEAMKGVLTEGVTISDIKITRPPRNLYNNPIELPEKEKKGF